MKLSNQNLLLLAVVGVVIYIIFFSKKKASGSTTDFISTITGNSNTTSSTSSSTTSGGVTIAGSAGAVTLNDSTVVAYGNKGEAVRAMQREILLKVPGALPKYGADGNFGTETLNALRTYWNVSTASAAWIRNNNIKTSSGNILGFLGF